MPGNEYCTNPPLGGRGVFFCHLVIFFKIIALFQYYVLHSIIIYIYLCIVMLHVLNSSKYLKAP